MIRIDTFDLSDEARIVFEKAGKVLNRIRLHIGCMAAGFQKEDAYLRAVILYLNCIRAVPAGLEEIYEEEVELETELLEELIQYLKENVLNIPSEERTFADRSDYGLERIPESALSSSGDQKEEIAGLTNVFSDYFFLEHLDKQFLKLASIVIKRYDDIKPTPDPGLAAASILRMITEMDEYTDSVIDFVPTSDAISIAFEIDIEEIDDLVRTFKDTLLTKEDIKELVDMFPDITLPPNKDGGHVIAIDFVTGKEAEELERLMAENHIRRAKPRKRRKKKPPENQLSLFD